MSEVAQLGVYVRLAVEVLDQEIGLAREPLLQVRGHAAFLSFAE
jgi:hypothetical protein